MSKIAIYPGSFDPVTNGHVDIIERALKIFDHIIIAVAKHPHKEPFFTLEERLEMLTDSLKKLKRVKVDSLDGLLINYVNKQKAHVIIRGVRAMTDFEYEFQMALMNRKLDDKIETVFLMPNEIYSYVSSSVIKEIASYGGNINGLVPDIVRNKINAKLNKNASSK
ncbi:MAG: pantetheine-phosphate adenylyltransferase [bacterium]|nr:pantetheine-phosphate adenylyltransferase [bacterium]